MCITRVPGDVHTEASGFRGTECRELMGVYPVSAHRFYFLLFIKARRKGLPPQFRWCLGRQKKVNEVCVQCDVGMEGVVCPAMQRGEAEEPVMEEGGGLPCDEQ